jgi:hypothetical protein
VILRVFAPHLLKARGHFNRACKRKGETDNRSCSRLVRDERESLARRCTRRLGLLLFAGRRETWRATNARLPNPGQSTHRLNDSDRLERSPFCVIALPFRMTFF